MAKAATPPIERLRVEADEARTPSADVPDGACRCLHQAHKTVLAEFGWPADVKAAVAHVATCSCPYIREIGDVDCDECPKARATLVEHGLLEAEG